MKENSDQGRGNSYHPNHRRTRKYILVDPLMKRYKLLVLIVIVLSLLMAPLVFSVRLDRTMKSAYVTSSPAYGQYREFLDTFGDDEFVLIAIRNARGIDNSHFIKALDSITSEIKGFNEVDLIISPSNLKLFGERDGLFGSYPIVVGPSDRPRLPDAEKIDEIRKTIPVGHYLFSEDLKCAGLIVRLRDEWRFNPKTGDVLDRILRTAQKGSPEGSDVRMVGAPVLREAVQRHTLRTALIFGCLCTLIISLVTLYIFKSFRVALIAMVVVGVSVYWVMALMALAKTPLNATTSLSFGLVLVIGVANVIHIVSHYYEASRHEEDHAAALRKALALIVRPCLMCSLTTAVAFATIMVSSIPMVRQLGMVMSLGVMISFVLALILTTAFLMLLPPLEQKAHDRMSEDWMASLFRGIGRFVFRHYKLCAASGFVFCLLMIAGTPLIRIDTQILRLFVDSSNELSDIRYVEKHLTPIRTVELVAQLDPSSFKKLEAWKKIRELQKNLANIAEVRGVDSLIPLLPYLHKQLADPGSDPEDLYRKKGLIAQLLTVASFDPYGKRMLRGYLSRDFGTIRLTVRTNSFDPTPVSDIIESIKTTAARTLGPSARILVTGEQAVFAAQASEVVRSQIYSLVLAIVGITLLIAIQLRSPALAVISLIPNIPPIAVILGLMGWLGIPLDNVTVFAVAIAIGLAVDDTIHYLTQLRRDMASAPPGDFTVKNILEQSYLTTARTLISTSATLFFGFLALSLTPTQPAIYFGFLGAAAIVVALWGDLVFLPSVALSIKPISRLLERETRLTAGRGAAPTTMAFSQKDRL